MNRSFAWVFAVLAAQRIFELAISRRNRRFVEASGGREFHRESFRNIAALHTGFYLSLLYESRPWMLPVDARTILCLAALAVLSGIRYWCMAALGRYWNVRIVAAPGMTVARRGPYRFLRHPNYLVVVLEFLFLPLLLRAPVTLIVFSAANALVLTQRIRFEEEALRETARPA